MKKNCIDIRQSKKLIELGIDINTADMHYTYHHWQIDENTIGSQSDASIGVDLDLVYNGESYGYIPCWSLSVLLSVLPDYTLQTNTDGTVFVVCDSKKPMISDAYDNPIDAAYEMVIKLNELNK